MKHTPVSLVEKQKYKRMVQKIKHDVQGDNQVQSNSETSTPLVMHKTLDILMKKAKKFDKE